MKQQYVICQYFPEEPLEVYGTFDTEKAAREYAERQGFALYNGTYTVHKVLDVKEEPE